MHTRGLPLNTQSFNVQCLFLLPSSQALYRHW